MAKRHEIRLGTCGWSYDDWVGPFYPEGTTSADYLSVYSQHYDIIEVDSTFYRSPSHEQIDRWRVMTPRKFHFTLKVPQLITHEKVLLGCRDDFRAFVEVVRGLENKLFAVLLQFQYFNKQAFPHPQQFFERLEEFLDSAGTGVPIAVEIRNKTWLSPDWFELLRRHQAMAVLVDHPWMPTIPEMVKRFDVVTGKSVYVRLIGDREAIEKQTKSWEKVVVDRTEALKKTAEALQQISARTDVIVFVNNHYAGHAPGTLAQLATFIGHSPSIDD
jgi:uncharacterized protein YecE (DUF72 family)